MADADGFVDARRHGSVRTQFDQERVHPDMNSSLAAMPCPILVWSLAGLQAIGLAVVVARLLPGRHRVAPVPPGGVDAIGTAERVSVVVPVRNEGARIGPCLDGLIAQDAAMREAIFVDGNSTDDTAARIDAAMARDRRVRRIAEPPRSADMVGRPWAIAAGCRAAGGEWILVVDADVAPCRGMVAGALAAARTHSLDVVSFSPRIIAPTAGARFLQPAFVVTLIYRFGAAGAANSGAERVIANGQCLLMRASTLEQHGGYKIAARSFCDDIRIVRHLAERGARVGFLDGTRLFDVLMYRDAAETWRGWPRSLNMRDATRARWRWMDSALLLVTQALPIPLLVFMLLFDLGVRAHPAGAVLFAINAALLLIRILLLVAIAPSFAPRGAPFWLSPLADPLAAVRVVETTIRRPREWRGMATVRDNAAASVLEG